MLKKKILILSGKKFRGVLKLTLLENSYLYIELTAHFLPLGDYAFLLMVDDHIERFSFDGEKLTKRLAYTLDIEKPIECAVIDYEPPYVLMSATHKGELGANFLYLIRAYVKERNQTFSTSEQTDKQTNNVINKTFVTDKDNIEQKKAGAPEDVIIEKSTSNISGKEVKPAYIFDESSSSDDAFFFNSIKDSIDDFFEKYPPFKLLSDIVPSSKWVKVDTEDTYYVVGLLYNTSGVTHICYGIPGEYTIKPPSDTLTEWLPINPEEWEKQGFWIIYQNAQTGMI